MSGVPIPQGASIDQGTTAPAGTSSVGAVPIPAGASVDPDSTGYSEKPNFKTGQTDYTYPAGQKAYSPDHPEISIDDHGNIYHKGTKIDPSYMALGPPAIGSVVKAGAGAVAKAFAPRAVTETVGTGIMDSAGKEITKEVTTQGPSIAKAMLSNPTFQKVVIHAAREGLPGLAGATWLWKTMFGK